MILDAALTLLGCVYKLTELFFFNFTALFLINMIFFIFLCANVNINNLRESV